MAQPDLPARLMFRQGIRFDDPRSWQFVRDELNRLAQPTLLVLDPLRDMLVGDENDSSTISAINRSVHAILADFPDVTVILLHHLNKRGDGEGGSRLRGSSALWGTADNTIIWKADPIPDDTPEGAEVPLRGKAYVEPRTAARAVIAWAWEPETGEIVPAESEGSPLADRAADYLRSNGPTDTPHLAEALDHDQPCARGRPSDGTTAGSSSGPAPRPAEPVGVDRMTGRNAPLRPRCDGGESQHPAPGVAAVLRPPGTRDARTPRQSQRCGLPRCDPLLAQVSVLPADHAHGLRVVLVCPHGTSRATLLGVPQDWAPACRPSCPSRRVARTARGCGCAASVTTKEARA